MYVSCLAHVQYSCAWPACVDMPIMGLHTSPPVKNSPTRPRPQRCIRSPCPPPCCPPCADLSGQVPSGCGRLHPQLTLCAGTPDAHSHPSSVPGRIRVSQPTAASQAARVPGEQGLLYVVRLECLGQIPLFPHLTLHARSSRTEVSAMTLGWPPSLSLCPS